MGTCLDKQNHVNLEPIHSDNVTLGGIIVVPEIRQFDIGTKLILRVYDQDGNNVNLEDALSLKIKFRKPNYTTVEVIGSYQDENDLYYITQLNFLDVVGKWKMQGVVEMNDGTWNTNIVEFEVLKNL